MTRNNNTKYVLITDDMNGMGLFRRGDVFVKHFYAFSGDVALKHYAEKTIDLGCSSYRYICKVRFYIVLQ